MSKKQEFIDYVEVLMKTTENSPIEMSDSVRMYWEAFKGENAEKPLFTDNGKLILKYMQAVSDMPMMKAKDIAEGMLVSSRTVSGAIRKLVSDGYVEKVGQDPVVYALTEKGKTINID